MFAAVSVTPLLGVLLLLLLLHTSSELTVPLQACQKYCSPFSPTTTLPGLFAKTTKVFLQTNSKIQTFLTLVTDDTTWWELDQYFKQQ